MKTTIKIAEEYLKSLESKNVPFEDVFQVVKKELFSKWQEEAPELNETEICEIRRGELYKILTVSGKFKRTDTGEWFVDLN